ncbi:MAG: hypothetical protein JSW72_02770 [Candidatus Bathyarchaeota archaeon]|nr:MAG: hypothetical protein JSW72_02770 [Candidatus Bathyarchaeota archaeon]
MSEGTNLIKKMIPIIAITWFLSLATSLAMHACMAIVYVAPYAPAIADEAVTNVKLAPQAIPFVSTCSTDFNTTTETTQYVDMSGMSVNLTLNRESHLLIMFSVEAFTSENRWMAIRALVGQDVAQPGEIYLTPNIYPHGLEGHFIDASSYGYNFFQPSVGPGTYNIKVQWKVSGGTGYVIDRTLTIMALPE